MMNATEWDKIADIVEAASELAYAQRHEYLKEHCGDDDVLFARLVRMVEGAAALGSEVAYPSDLESMEASEDSFDRHNVVGTLLEGRFYIEKDLGSDGTADRSGMGDVYLARDKKLLDQKVVVKILKQEYSARPEILRKFEHEKEALVRIDHPGIVRILDSGNLASGNPFIVIEYIAGESLRRRLRRCRTLPLETVAHITAAVTDALGTAHAEGVLHRDIKPENVMITPQSDGTERVRLIDFGIARIADPLSAPVTTVERRIGTMSYMPAEQLLGKLELTAAVDTFAVAAMTYEMLAGKRPFAAQNEAEMILELQRDAPQVTVLRPSAGPEVGRLIRAGLAYGPADRPQDIRKFGTELSQMLRNAAEDEDRSASQVTASNETAPPKPRVAWRMLAAVAALAAVALVAVAAIYIAFNGVTPTAVAEDKSQPDAARVPGVGVFSYRLEAQKGLPSGGFGQSYTPAEAEIFTSGDRLRIHLSALSAGYLYAFAEGLDDQGRSGFWLLHPSPGDADSSKASPQKELSIGWNKFRGKPGTEKVWIIWSRRPVNELETVVRHAFEKGVGRVANSDLGTVRDSLNETTEATTALEGNTRSILINGDRDTVVHKLDVTHQ